MNSPLYCLPPLSPLLSPQSDSLRQREIGVSPSPYPPPLFVPVHQLSSPLTPPSLSSHLLFLSLLKHQLCLFMPLTPVFYALCLFFLVELWSNLTDWSRLLVTHLPDLLVTHFSRHFFKILLDAFMQFNNIHYYFKTETCVYAIRSPRYFGLKCWYCPELWWHYGFNILTNQFNFGFICSSDTAVCTLKTCWSWQRSCSAVDVQRFTVNQSSASCSEILHHCLLTPWWVSFHSAMTVSSYKRKFFKHLIIIFYIL